MVLFREMRPPTEERVLLPGSERTPLRGARDLGPSTRDGRFEVTVWLRRGSEPSAFPAVHELGTRLPSERSYLSREQFAQTHGARADDLARVRAYAARYGLEVLEEAPARRSVVLRGSTPSLEAAFGASLRRYVHPGGSYRGRAGPLSIPVELADTVLGVFGLDDRPQVRSHLRRCRTPGPSAFSPLEVARAYGFPPGSRGDGQTIGILEFGGGFAPDDLSAYFSKLGLAAPNVDVVSVDGTGNAPTGSPDGPDGEVELDLEIAGAVAPGARLVVYFAPNTDRGFLDALTTAVHDSTRRPSLISISWGGPEPTWTTQARAALSSVAEEAGALGVTVLAAAGDQGSADGEPAGELAVDFPASSPYVLGCGGTKLRLGAGGTRAESTWNELSAGEGATGGGVSIGFPRPTFQAGASVPAAPNGFAGRGVPDVAGDADPTTGYEVLVDSQAVVLGGTSAVAPLWAGLLARINQALGTPVGFVTPLLYRPESRPAFHDITEGSNGFYAARPGWDACTGLGSPDGSALLGLLKPAAPPRRANPAPGSTELRGR